MYNRTISDYEYEKLKLNEEINVLNTNSLTLKNDIDVIQHDRNRLISQREIEKSKFNIESKHMND